MALQSGIAGLAALAADVYVNLYFSCKCITLVCPVIMIAAIVVRFPAENLRKFIVIFSKISNHYSL